jgi:hypothetical protein
MVLALWTVDHSISVYRWAHATWMRTHLHAPVVRPRVRDLGIHVLLGAYGQVEHPLDEAALRLVQVVDGHLHEQVVVQDLHHQEIQIVAPVCLGARWEQETDSARPPEVQADCDRVLRFLDQESQGD